MYLKNAKEYGDDAAVNVNNVMNDHHMALLHAVANAASCEPNNILDLDLYLYDHQKAVNFLVF